MKAKRFNVLNIFGIKIGIDLSWFLIAVFLSWTLASAYFPFRFEGLTSGAYWFMGIAGMLGLFICVILHELGHALVAKHYKLPISQITLFLFGGVAEIEEEPQSPKVEFLMAIAGPLVSVAIVLVMYLITQAGNGLGWPVTITGVTSYLATVNLFLAAFNLIPAFPLDGGRVFRALLWGWKKNLAWATQIATRLGRGFGFALIFFGIFLFISGNFLAGVWLGILGLFLKRAASASQTQFYVLSALKGAKVQKFMRKDPISVPPNVTIQEFVELYIAQSHHHLYPVTEKGNLIGSISLQEIKSLSPEEWKNTSVKDAMIPNPQTISPTTSALEALNLMQQTDTPTLLVVEGKHLVGILTPKDLFAQISHSLGGISCI
jgi:Zn-dependent protease/CBS domain-containing protein